MAPESRPLVVFERCGVIVLAHVRKARMLDAINVAEFGQQLSDFIAANPGVCLLIDFEQVDYLSSAVLTELLRANSAARQTEGSVRLCGLSQDIQEVFTITNLDKVFTIYQTDDAQEAAKRFIRSIEVEAQEKSWERFRVDE
jgi:anti-sigma B factor antagonist